MFFLITASILRTFSTTSQNAGITMNIFSKKLGLIAIFMTVLITGCSSTSTTDDQISDDSVATGAATGSGVSGSSLDDLAANADTVFYFDFDKSVLKPEAKAALRIHANALRNNPRSVRLEGHADERGTREYNMALGERRANAVKEFLMLEGVSGSILEVISYGEESPIALGSDSQSWALNRRVEMK